MNVSRGARGLASLENIPYLFITFYSACHQSFSWYALLNEWLMQSMCILWQHNLNRSFFLDRRTDFSCQKMFLHQKPTFSCSRKPCSNIAAAVSNTDNDSSVKLLDNRKLPAKKDTNKKRVNSALSKLWSQKPSTFSSWKPCSNAAAAATIKDNDDDDSVNDNDHSVDFLFH